MIILKPYDVFLLSDGRGFKKGESNFRESVFFINPIPILGAVNKITGKKLNVEFISLIKNNKLYFRAPITIKKVKKENKIVLPKLKKLKTKFITKQPVDYILDYDTQEKLEDINSYVDFDILIDFLLDKPINITEEKKLMPTYELRTGIEINKETGTTQERMLYTQNFIRLEEGGFYIKFNENVDLDFATVGGEGKLFVAKNSQDFTKDFEKVKNQIKEKVRENEYFKIVLLTSTNAVPEIDGARLIAKFIGKHITYSGWMSFYKDKKNLPTRIYRLIPEGSVFYYKLEDKSKIDKIFERFWLKPSFLVKEYPYFDPNNTTGFGLSIIGITKMEEQL